MKDIIAYSSPKSKIAKRYIDLKDSIVSLSDGNMRTVMITSPKEINGHDDLAANLAVVMSKSGYNTLIVDCNIENGVLHKTFDVNTEMGLTDYVLKNKALTDVMKKTELDNLNVITVGEQDIDILGNKKIKFLIEEGKKQFDYVIINAPVVLNGNGSQVLAKYCDGIVIVVEHEKTEIEDMKKVQVKLDRFQEKILGCVLNKYKEY